MKLACFYQKLLLARYRPVGTHWDRNQGLIQFTWSFFPVETGMGNKLRAYASISPRYQPPTTQVNTPMHNQNLQLTQNQSSWHSANTCKTWTTVPRRSNAKHIHVSQFPNPTHINKLLTNLPCSHLLYSNFKMAQNF